MKTLVGIPTLNGPEQLRRCLCSIRAETPPDDNVVVFVADDGSKPDHLEGNKGVCAEHGIELIYGHGRTGIAATWNRLIRHVPDAETVVLLNDDIEVVPDWLDSLRPEHRVLTGDAYRFSKRIMDIGLVVATAPFWLPLMALCALAIKVDDPRAPVLFVQERAGVGGRTFRMHKFRTMVPNGEEKKWELRHLNELEWPDFKITNDPRMPPPSTEVSGRARTHRQGFTVSEIADLRLLPHPIDFRVPQGSSAMGGFLPPEWLR